MPIIFHKKTKEFHLYNEKISYIFKILANGHPGHIYYGRRLTDRDSFGGMIITPSVNHTMPWWEACMNRLGISLDDYKAETGWKEYTPGTGTSSTDTTVNYGAGDVVPFELSTVIPQSVESYGAYRIVFHDTSLLDWRATKAV